MADNKQNQPNSGGDKGRGQSGAGAGAAGGAAQGASQAAAGVADKARQGASQAADQARGVASQAADQARGLADQARSVAAQAGQHAETAMHSVASGMQALSGTVREHVPGGAGATAAAALEQGGRYLQDEGFQGMADDLSRVVRQNPLPAVLVSIGIGFVLAQILTPRS